MSVFVLEQISQSYLSIPCDRVNAEFSDHSWYPSEREREREAKLVQWLDVFSSRRCVRKMTRKGKKMEREAAGTQVLMITRKCGSSIAFWPLISTSPCFSKSGAWFQPCLSSASWMHASLSLAFFTASSPLSVSMSSYIVSFWLEQVNLRDQCMLLLQFRVTCTPCKQGDKKRREGEKCKNPINGWLDDREMTSIQKMIWAFFLWPLPPVVSRVGLEIMSITCR